MRRGIGDWKIAIIGGDDREIALMHELLSQGAVLTATGFPDDKMESGVRLLPGPEEAARGAELVILPFTGVDRGGFIRAPYAVRPLRLTEKAIAAMASPAWVVIGLAPPYLKDWQDKYDFTLIELLQQDEIAILNSIPTAEGAVQLAMEQTDHTLHGSNTCIIGFGRVGTTLGRVMKALSAEVTVVSRDRAELARALEMGCRAAEWEELGDVLPQCHIIFNTVPVMVLDRLHLHRIQSGRLVIDLASGDGGTDFSGAGDLGIRAVHALGLPGKVAPASAGSMLARAIIKQVITGGSGSQRGAV